MFNRKIRKALSLLLCLALCAGLLCAPAHAAPTAEGTEIVSLAMRYIDKVPYVWGGNTIDGDNPGADCTGFICAIFEKFGFDLWSDRTTLQNRGKVIGTNLDDARPGDILWYSGHAAIYAGKENGTHMIVHETGGIHTDVIYAKASTVTNAFRGIIHIDGVTHNGMDHDGSSVSTSSGASKVTFSLTTDPTYLAKVTYTDTNAFLVNRVTKPAGTSCTQMGLYLSDANGNLIIRHIQPEHNVRDSLTSFHCYWDINEEIGITLTPGTTYQYAFLGVFDGEEVVGPTYTFTTTGSASSSACEVTFHANGGSLSGDSTRKVSSGTVFGSVAPIPTRDGYDFAGWYTKSSGGSAFSDSSVITEDLDVYAHWTKAAAPSWDVNFYDGLTGAYVDTILATNGEPYGDLPEPTKSGYRFLGWYTQKSGGNEITSSSVVSLSADQNLYSHWEKATTTDQLSSDSRFPDVPANSIYAEPVAWAVQQGITGGTDTGLFAPEQTCTRGQVVTFLWRAMGCPEPSTTRNPFKDVSSSDYYYKAVLWAVEEKITSGTSNTTFSPDIACTRAQAVAFLYKCAGSPAYGTSTSFKDVDSSAYYAPAVAWAVDKAITSGTGSNTFSPNNICTRGQIVTFLYRSMG